MSDDRLSMSKLSVLAVKELNEPGKPGHGHHARNREDENAQSNVPEGDVKQKHDDGTSTLQRFKENAEKVEKQNTLVSADFGWLKGKANERAIFWVWLLLRWLPVENKIHSVAIQNKNSHGWPVNIPGDTVIYDFLQLQKETASTKERSFAIINFFYELEKHSNSVDTRRLLEKIRSIWMNFIHPVRNVVWLNKKNESELDSIWDYLLKKKELSGCILNWFKPVDNNERRLAIIGAIDSFILHGDLRDIDTKKTILYCAYKNSSQTKRREKIANGNKKAGLNAEISQKAKNALVKMASEKDMRINKFIEKIILDEYARFNNKK
ncbi:hypothetical protein DRX19_28825 [Salmonella enterica subsp. enterica]|nr:hypothetical protein [Salmonella enterica subsp. enterica serovar Pensacola]